MIGLRQLIRRVRVALKTPLPPNPSSKKEFLQKSLEANLKKVRNEMGASTDVVTRTFRIGTNKNFKAALIYMDGLANTQIINYLLESLTLFTIDTDPDKSIQEHNLLSLLRDTCLTNSHVTEISDFETLFESILSGNTVILIEGQIQGFSASTAGFEHRNVSEPLSQSVVRGPQEGFNELLRTNTSLIRRRIKSPDLWLETKQIGRYSKTDVGIMYIKGIANEKMVEEVRTRLDRINIDAILDSGYIEELVQDKTLTPFPTMFNSERPDVVAAGLVEGRIAIIVDGSPFVLLVPALFVQFYHSAEDYYQRSDFGLIRFLRLIALVFALLGPSLYIAITSFHQQLIPPTLLINLAAQREGTPFPAFVEALIMEVTFEILREAGIRMPRSVGQAVSIVGALVIGQAAVEAGLVSAAMVIVVAINRYIRLYDT